MCIDTSMHKCFVICNMPCILKKQCKILCFLSLLSFNNLITVYIVFQCGVAPRCTRNNDDANTDTHKHALNGLLVGGIRDNKGSRKWSKNTRIRRNEEKRSGGARRAEEAETGSHRVMWEQRRLWEVWCKGLDLSNGNRLATQRGQLPLSCSLSLSAPLSGQGGTGRGLKCKRGRGSETGGKWEEQRAQWGRYETEMVPVPLLEHGRGKVFVHVCGCGCVLGPVRLHMHVCIPCASLKRQHMDCC